MQLKDLWRDPQNRALFSVLLYTALMSTIFIVSHLVFSYFGFLHTDADTARYLLNTLVSSEAGIFAIVVTLSLIAVQLAASSYSARVIDLFMKTPDPWMLMLIYIAAMVYSLGVLKLVDEESVSRLEIYISLSYYMGIFAFTALILFIWNTFDLLQPFTIIDRLSERITKQHILSLLSRQSPFNNDPVQPIIDIVLGSWGKYDYETMGYGLRAISSRADCVLRDYYSRPAEKAQVADHISGHFFKVGTLALNRKDDDFAGNVFLSLNSVGLVSTQERLEGTVQSILKFFGNTGIRAAEEKLEKTAFEAVRHLRSIGEAAAQRQMGDAARTAAFYMAEVGVVAAEQELENTASFAATNLEEFRVAAARQELHAVAQQCELSLNDVREALSNGEGPIDPLQRYS
ncbi:MAG TPA: DUF2254 family protein [Methanotrichaceae archaeon]|nr:DUF2254 family protein [Methanotrichaceae archaeon]